MKDKILSQMITECPWRDTLYWYDEIDSTNTRARELAKAGAVHGTVLVAKSQTGGRGEWGAASSPLREVYICLSFCGRTAHRSSSCILPAPRQ